MLLPSDVARLVLGYLQQEKLTSTCKSFIAESPNLKEYAEHHMDDGAIPGCLLSLFGKNLTTILNEYVTMKAKENEAEIPFMMSSLWKKLDLTLSQIRCMQESAAFQTNQRARTRRGINDRMRQKMLTSPLAVMGSPASHPVAPQTSTPIMATQYILHPIITPGSSQSVNPMQTSTPASNSLGQTSQVASATSIQKKLSTAATSSPMRRKPECQRRRRAAGSAAAERDTGLDSDTIQGIIDDDFPQLVIENAREKILSNKCLQEKLAENINKILASDSATQTTKQGDGAPADDTSIDEILGLQGGEIHMSEEAIQDILVQTELDPDFQELYDLFACVTSKAPKNTPHDPSTQNSDTKASGSKKRDVWENAEQAANKITNGPMEKESNRLDLETSSVEKADDASNPQPTCVNETTVSGSQSSHGEKQPDLVLVIDGSDGETVMDTSKEAQRTVIKAASSQIQDVEMENIPLTDDAAGNYCFVVEDVLPQVSVCEDGPLPATMCSGGSDIVKPSEMTIGKDLAKGKPSNKSEQETDRTVTATQPSTSVLQCVVLDQSSTPVLSCPSTQSEKESQPVAVGSPLNKPCSDVADKQGSKSDSAEKDVVSQNAPLSVDHPVSHGQSSLAPEMAAYSTGIVVSSGSQPVVDSNIVTLNIITEEVLPEDVEIHSAIRSINEENYSTIILSPLVNPQEVRRVNSASGDVVESTVIGEQSQLLATSTDSLVNSINISNGECTVYTMSGTASTADGSVIQLMPASGSTFTSTSSLFLSPCVANNVPAKQPNIMMLSNNSNNSQKQGSLYQTPPRPSSMYTMGQTISPKLSQGSTFILASPVQPVLQGVMGMFPMSLVSQSGSTYTAQPHQILHVPISKPVVPKLPLPPKSQKPLPKLAATTGKPMFNTAVDSTSRSSSSMQRENGEKNSASEAQRKPDERSLPEIRSVEMKPVEAHRRVLCFDGTSTSLASNSPATLNLKGQKKDKSDTTQNLAASTETVSSKRNVSKGSKKTESSTVSTEKTSKVDVGSAPATDQSGEKRPTSSSGESGGNKENVQQVGAEKHGAAQAEKRMSSQENLNTEKSGKPQQETVRKQASLPNILRRTPQKNTSERVCSTSPLAKQASQLLQDIQFHSPTSMHRSSGDIPIPRTPGSAMEERVTDKPSEHRRTPMSRRYNEDLGTPKPMMPPATPELPTCSPASEAGSESSVNMAAHTLMILSRASISKSSGNTPLKGNTTQSKSTKSIGKKRRLEEDDEYERRSQRKELLSPSSLQKKKKMKKRKRSTDRFPAGMDVEKFLMSLHYDE